MGINLYCDDCLNALPKIGDKSINAIITDPPYPEIDRSYGKISELDWMDLMKVVVLQSKRILKDDGSAMFILQPNSRCVGSMRIWMWEFVTWCGKEWNLIQDVWWHNPSAQPNVHSQRKYGLMRPSMKMCVWLGSPTCYRNQNEVLLPLKITKHNKTNTLKHKPSGYTMREARCLNTSIERGGSTPFNFLKFANVYKKKCAGGFGHGAGTPIDLLDWWVRYITRPGDLVLDMFSGTASTGLVCKNLGRNYIGIEKDSKFHEFAQSRFRPQSEQPQPIVPLPRPPSYQ